MQTKPKSNSVITSKLVDGAIVFTIATVGDLQLRLDALSQEVRERAMIHGLTQRVSDAAAIGFLKDEKRFATPQEKYDAMAELVAHYSSGTAEWSRTRSAPGIGADSALLVKCLSQLYTDRSTEQLKAWVAKRSRSERTALLLSEKIKPLADEIRSQSASGASADDLIADLETMPESQSDE